MEELNREEIARLRERVHEQGNVLQEHAAYFMKAEGTMSDLDRKLDAIHLSIKGQISELKADMKEDLNEIKAETSQTNGRVTELERKSARTDGGIAVMALGLPVVTGLLVYVLIQLLQVGAS